MYCFVHLFPDIWVLISPFSLRGHFLIAEVIPYLRDNKHININIYIYHLLCSPYARQAFPNPTYNSTHTGKS